MREFKAGEGVITRILLDSAPGGLVLVAVLEDPEKLPDISPPMDILSRLTGKKHDMES